MKRNYLLFIFIFLLLILHFFPGQAYLQSETIVRVDPAMRVVDTGEPFSIDVIVENVENLSGFDVTMGFNPDHLVVTGLTIGEFLSPGLGGNDFDNETGQIHFYNAILSFSEPNSGSGILFTINFEAKSVDTLSNLTILEPEGMTILTNGDGVEIPCLIEHGTVAIGNVPNEFFFTFLPLVLH